MSDALTILRNADGFYLPDELLKRYRLARIAVSDALIFYQNAITKPMPDEGKGEA